MVCVNCVTCDDEFIIYALLLLTCYLLNVNNNECRTWRIELSTNRQACGEFLWLVTCWMTIVIYFIRYVFIFCYGYDDCCVVKVRVNCVTCEWLGITCLSNAFVILLVIIYSLGISCCTLLALPRSTLPSTLCGTVLVATPQSQSAFIKWTGWTIAMALSYSDTTVNIVVVIIILVIVIIVITLYSSVSGLVIC